ncbi:MAG: alanine racemase [Proteobacteria bacterium]|nr:alanine racemase [Pseudomonadota bacterium]MBK9252950.1 alanine racemase [Pseudomonadota bacterium]
MKSLIRAEVSAAALRANLARVREVAPASRVMAVVKANAYGHGLVPTALCLADADAFGVARIDEALALRGAGVRGRIVLLEGVFNAEQLAEAARQSLDIVVHEAEQLELLEAAPSGQRFVVWAKIDTGMNRLGFRPSMAQSALRRLDALGERLLELRLMTHFASADERDSSLMRQQLARFDVLTQGRRSERSLANSAALFAQPQSHADWVRPGLALYGVSPFADQVGRSLGLTPAMRLVSTVIAVRKVSAGETVGYGGVWRAARDSQVAIVAAGYGDGLPRALPNGTPVLIRGARGELAGRVSMDMIAVDVTGIAGVQVGDAALLWGPELPVEEIAAHAGSISYELLCAVSQRVPLALM